MTTKILFVCTGNICRSPMAERMMQKMLEEKNFSASVTSAGTQGITGSNMTSLAAKSLEARGYSALNHTARQLTRAMLEEADLVLTATLGHLKFISNLSRDYLGHSFTIAEFAEWNGEITKGISREFDLTTQGDIFDPYGYPAETYEDVANVIESKLHSITPKLVS